MKIGDRVRECRRWRYFNAPLRAGTIFVVDRRIGGLIFFDIAWDGGTVERGIPDSWVEPQDAVSALAGLADAAE